MYRKRRDADKERGHRAIRTRASPHACMRFAIDTSSSALHPQLGGLPVVVRNEVSLNVQLCFKPPSADPRTGAQSIADRTGAPRAGASFSRPREKLPHITFRTHTPKARAWEWALPPLARRALRTNTSSRTARYARGFPKSCGRRRLSNPPPTCVTRVSCVIFLSSFAFVRP